MKFSELENSTQVILKVIFAGLSLWFLWSVRGIILLLLLALILASAMDPAVDYLKKKKIPRTVSVLAVYVLVLGLAGLIIYLMVPPVISQFEVLRQQAPELVMHLQDRLGGVVSPASISNFFRGFLNLSGSGVVSSTFGVFNGVLWFIGVLVIAFYLVAAENGMKSFIATLVPPKSQEFTLNLIEKIQAKMGKWVLGQLLVSLGIFVFTLIGLLILKVQYALVLALLAGLLEIVPYIGPFISAIPAMFVGFIQYPSLAIWVAILYVFVHEFEAYLLVPKIMEKTVGTSSLVVLLALLVGYDLAGVIGLLISVPVVSAINVVINEFWPGKPPQ